MFLSAMDFQCSTWGPGAVGGAVAGAAEAGTLVEAPDNRTLPPLPCPTCPLSLAVARPRTLPGSFP